MQPPWTAAAMERLNIACIQLNFLFCAGVDTMVYTTWKTNRQLETSLNKNIFFFGNENKTKRITNQIHERRHKKG
jgi:hypothetical protein